MTPPVRPLALLLYYCVACDGPDSAGPPAASRALEPPAAALPDSRASEIPPSTTTAPPALEPPGPERSPPLRMVPRTLALSWQSYLGRRVWISCRSVRRIDFVRTLIVAEGVRFIVTGPADVTPCSVTTSTFTVMGSTSASLGGRTVLPELLLEENREESPR